MILLARPPSKAVGSSGVGRSVGYDGSGAQARGEIAGRSPLTDALTTRTGVLYTGSAPR